MLEVLTLEAHIKRMFEWFESQHEIPAWQEQLILDTSDPNVHWVAKESGGWHAPDNVLQSPTEYSSRFAGLLGMGYSWINLSIYGIFNDDLIIGVELPHEPVGIPVGRTSVNYSGPSLDVRNGEPIWKLRLTLDHR